MKHCDNCNKGFDTAEQACHVCGAILSDMTSDENIKIVSTMTLTGIL